jgi:hypothetical protein
MARRHPKVPIGVESSANRIAHQSAMRRQHPPAGPLIAGICGGSRGEAGREWGYGLVMLRGGTGASRRHGSILPSACMAPAQLVRRRARERSPRRSACMSRHREAVMGDGQGDAERAD